MSPYVSFNMTHKYKSDGVKFRINYKKFGGMAKIIARNKCIDNLYNGGYWRRRRTFTKVKHFQQPCGY